MSEILHVSLSHQLLESDQETELSGKQEKVWESERSNGSLLSGLDRFPCKITHYQNSGLARDKG